MLSRNARVVAVVLAAVVAVLALGSTYRGGAAPAACARTCAQAVTAAAPAHSPCVTDPGCGGGTHAPVLASVVDVTTAATVVAAAALLGTVRRRSGRAPYPGRLAAAGLYRPPRHSV